MIIGNKKIIYFLTGAVLIVGVLLSLIYFQKDNQLKVVFLNVGQGDAILIQGPDGQDILIDGGPGNKVIHELDKHMPFWNRDIELVILTHPHADHVQGLVEVLKRYKVEKVLGYEIDYNSEDYLEWLRLIKEKEIPFSTTMKGDRFILGENIILETLYPFGDISGRHFEDVNNASIINKLCYFERCFLFTGDAPKKIEDELLKKEIDIKSDVLKVSHHGSKYSSGEDFLKTVSPRFAVIQSGENNKFNHPHLITVRHMEKLNIRVLRNDILGEILCQFNGGEIECFPPPCFLVNSLASVVRVISFVKQDVAAHDCNNADIQAGLFSWLDRSSEYALSIHPV